jgi:hypothetical protein
MFTKKSGEQFAILTQIEASQKKRFFVENTYRVILLVLKELIYKANAVKIYNATSRLMRFENKNILLYYEKRKMLFFALYFYSVGIVTIVGLEPTDHFLLRFKWPSHDNGGHCVR